VSKTVIEVASGLNGKRTKVSKLLADLNVTTIVVDYRKQLVRFGCVAAALSVQVCRYKVVLYWCWPSRGGCWRGAGGDRGIDVAVCAPAPAAQFPSQ
jgi:hypothetical protein